MPNTSLAPSLAHLLITEDKATGRLVLPNGSSPSKEKSSSPPHNPLSSPPFAFTNPSLPSTTFPLPPRLSESRRPEGLFSLLNDLRVRTPSPVSSGSEAQSPSDLNNSRPLIHRQSSADTLPSLRPPPPPPPPFFSSRQSVSVLRQPPSRPEPPRRVSSQNSIYTRPTSSYEHQNDIQQSSLGSRTPISRTTKACNACRNRKVRCDAGGGHGEPMTCSRCKEAGVECVYSGIQKKRGPCPGTTRPPQSVKSRRPSHRSSIASLNTPFVLLTPGEDSQSQSSRRSSYGFPFPTVTGPVPKSAPSNPPSQFHNNNSIPTTASVMAPTNPPPGLDPWQGWTSTQPLPRPSSKHRMSHAMPPPPISLRSDSIIPEYRKLSQPAPILSWPAMEPARVIDLDRLDQDFGHDRDGDIDVDNRDRDRDRSTKGFFAPGYSMAVPSSQINENPVLSRAPWVSTIGKKGKRNQDDIVDVEMSPPTFGGEGRTLPPLSVAIGRRSSYYAV